MRDGRIGREREALKGGVKLGQSGVSHGNCHVPQEAQVTGAPQWRMAKHDVKLILADGCQLFKRGRGEAGFEGGVRGGRRATVPGTDVLADIAPENVAADTRAALFGDRAAEFDGEVGNTKARVYRVALAGVAGAGGPRHNCGGGARVDATAAGPAAVRRRLVGGDFQGYEQLAQKKPGAGALMDEAGILADPSQARKPGVRAFEQRRGIHQHPGFKIRSRRVPSTGPPGA